MAFAKTRIFVLIVAQIAGLVLGVFGARADTLDLNAFPALAAGTTATGALSLATTTKIDGARGRWFGVPPTVSVFADGGLVDRFNGLNASGPTVANSTQKPLTLAAGSYEIQGLDSSGFATNATRVGGDQSADETMGLSYATASPAPEPATWALMLLGLAGAGFRARGANRRK